MTMNDGRRVFSLPGESQDGIQCPKCACRHFWSVTHTVPKTGMVHRRRECRNCGYKIQTAELPLPLVAKLLEEQREAESQDFHDA